MTPDVYLDSATASPLLPEARDAMVAALERFGDPLMIHRPGREARELIEDARQTVAAAISAQPDEIVFTSGGTESIALAIRGAAAAARRPAGRIVVSAIEHPAVRSAADSLATAGIRTSVTPVDGDGRVDVDRFRLEVRTAGTLLASIQHANHEIGTIQPVAECARLAREAGALVHTDAAQTLGRLPVDVQALGVDLLSVSARTFGGPPGVGALFVRRGVTVRGSPLGDERERKRRAGMPSTPSIAGMAAALRASLAQVADRAAEHWSVTASLRDRIAAEVPGAAVHGHPSQRVPHLVGFSIAGIDPATLMMALDDRGFHVGIGSPASGRPDEPSSVLAATGSPGRVIVRVGLGHEIVDEDVSMFADVLRDTVVELRRMDAASAEALTRYRAPEA